MSRDDEDRFRPRPGRIRSDARGGAATQSFFSRVRKIARQHGAGPPGASAYGKSGGSGGRTRGKVGVRRGRGAAFVRSRTLGERGWSHRQPGARRVMVKSRSVRAAGKNGRAAAHLRYIQRAFLDRGKDDRHQFRVIVSPEDGVELGDLSGFTRDLMTKLEGDLGTKLDWVAVNHFNTGHPHVHVIINGRDELGEDLVINGDYIAHGIRERASELVTLELGPVTAIEQQRKLAAEIDQDRFTRIDRALIAEAGEGLVDLRHAPADPRGISDRALRLARLGKLEAMGLAREPAPGRWQLSEKLEPTLRELGERGDIIKTMHRALQAEGLARDPASFWIHDGAPSMAIVGRIIDKHLSDELGENLTLMVDGIDGRTHHVPGIDPAGVGDISIGSIVEIGSTEAGRRPADRAIAGLAEEGVYRPSRHLEQARFEGSVPGGDHDGFIDAHVRRLEALRRAGIVERIDADHWRLPQDFESRAAVYDSARNRQLNIRVLSIFDLESQIEAEGATWLDRRLVGRAGADLVAAGFGRDVREAMDRRREHLIGQGDAVNHGDGRIFYRRNLLATREQRDVIRAGTVLAASRSLPFRVAGDGETVQGVFKQTVQLSSGKFALVENVNEFTLVPWRPVIENRLGREVMGVVQGGSVSWQFGRNRGLGL
jgi:type IV secretory pathway VirD2 relaxase